MMSVIRISVWNTRRVACQLTEGIAEEDELIGQVKFLSLGLIFERQKTRRVTVSSSFIFIISEAFQETFYI